MYGIVKMTMHIDEALLERVMREYEFPSKTEAVEAALKELDRQMRLREFRKNGLGLTPEELGNALYPDYDPDALRGSGYAHANTPAALADAVAEPAAPYDAAPPAKNLTEHGKADPR